MKQVISLCGHLLQKNINLKGTQLNLKVIVLRTALKVSNSVFNL